MLLEPLCALLFNLLELLGKRIEVGKSLEVLTHEEVGDGIPRGPPLRAAEMVSVVTARMLLAGGG